MDTSSSHSSTRRRRRLAVAGVLAAAAVGGTISAPLFAGAQPATQLGAKSTLQEVKIVKYGEVLANSAGYSLYVLSTESKGTLHCTSSACLADWPPLLVAKNSMISTGPGVKGKISHVTRGSRWQVTFNGWPVYTFVGDSGPGKSSGENFVAFSGTWYLVHAAATTNSGTPIKAAASSGTTSGGGTTTTTMAGYGY
ncbi:MAG: hypothetical protein ABSA65_16700 [Acidimicrobiales bacterium]